MGKGGAEGDDDDDDDDDDADAAASRRSRRRRPRDVAEVDAAAAAAAREDDPPPDKDDDDDELFDDDDDDDGLAAVAAEASSVSAGAVSALARRSAKATTRRAAATTSCSTTTTSASASPTASYASLSLLASSSRPSTTRAAARCGRATTTGAGGASSSASASRLWNRVGTTRGGGVEGEHEYAYDAFGGGSEKLARDRDRDRERRARIAYEDEIRNLREERVELESKVQGLRLRSAVAEWERDQAREQLDELELAWDAHRKALRREVTTRVKVGLDYGGGADGASGGADGDGGRLFPQEVLQAVVRGAVDQSVEAALGTETTHARERDERDADTEREIGVDLTRGGGVGSEDPEVVGLYDMVRDALAEGEGRASGWTARALEHYGE